MGSLRLKMGTEHSLRHVICHLSFVAF